MTNQDYMDLLERFSKGESTKTMQLSGAHGAVENIVYAVDTTVFSNPDMTKCMGTSPGHCPVIEIVNGELQMLYPNVMDAFMTKTCTVQQIRDLHTDNMNLQKANNSKVLNYRSYSRIAIPYYPDEAERFQRELHGEIVLYETHLKYVHNIVQECHDSYMKKMRETWDKAINL